MEEKLINFGAEDEVVLGEAGDFMCVDCDVHLAPGEAQVGVVTFLFGESTHAIDEFECGFEVGKQEGFGKVMFLDHFPKREPFLELNESLPGKGRNSSVAGRASLTNEFGHVRSTQISPPLTSTV